MFTKFLKENFNWLLLASGFLFLPFLFLLSPAPRESDQICGEFLTIANTFGFTVNCDAGGMVELAKNPGLVFTDKFLLQSRPGIIPVGIVFALPFVPFVKLGILPVYLGNTYLNFAFYAGFVLFNFTLLFTSLFIFTKLAKGFKFSRTLLIAGMFALPTSFLIKTFVFTAHMQMLNIFTPISAIALLYYFLKTKSFNIKLFLLLSFVVGIALLLYPSLILVLAGVFIAYIVKVIKPKGISVKTLLPLAVSGFFTLFPTFAWANFVKLLTGSFYNHAAEAYNQFTWVLDGFKGGIVSGITNLYNGFQNFIGQFSLEMNISLALLLLLLGLLIFLNKKERKILFKRVLPYLLLMLIFATFFFLLGDYWERLTYNILLLIQFNILILLQFWINKYKWLNGLGLLILFIFVVRFIVLIAQHGPYIG